MLPAQTSRTPPSIVWLPCGKFQSREARPRDSTAPQLVRALPRNSLPSEIETDYPSRDLLLAPSSTRVLRYRARLSLFIKTRHSFLGHIVVPFPAFRQFFGT